jgi:hypothetical protein
MIKYETNVDNIIQFVEIDLTRLTDEDRKQLDAGITTYLNHIPAEYRNIYNYDKGNRLVYETEVLLPKVNRKRKNLLIVLGNPAVHSVAEKMFFSFQKTKTIGKWREHRFWKALAECGLLQFCEILESPTPDNIKKINDYKATSLLNGVYKSDFNVSLLPLFSFPTPASGEYSGVNGISRILGRRLFQELKRFEAERFERIVMSNNITHVICFHKPSWEEIMKLDHKRVHISYVGSTRLILSGNGKQRLLDVLCDV